MYTLDFQEIDQAKLKLAGGKGANLGELSKIKGIRVPEGFCLTTIAYAEIVESNLEINGLLEELSRISFENREEVAKLCLGLRKVIEETAIPEEIIQEVNRRLSGFEAGTPFAVRSSATAEDLPTASFAGQQDTYLNIIGQAEILKHISKCWASLFTERAVIYRLQNNFPQQSVQLSVVIQKMVFPQASGIMFTAEPVTSNRKVLSIDAGFGLGEALVSGLVNPDIYKVRDGKIIDQKVSTKKLAIVPLEQGGTKEIELGIGQQTVQVLTDAQILQLERTGREIEAYFGRPQDIEWCLEAENLYIVQSRPITTLYPAPDMKDGKNRVYLSFGHRQMMTEAMSPLSMSFMKLMFANVTNTPLIEIGGRLYMDSSHEMHSPLMRKPFIKGLAAVDVLMQNAFAKLAKRRDFLQSLPREKKQMVGVKLIVYWLIKTIQAYIKNDPALAAEFRERQKAILRNLEQQAAQVSAEELLSFMQKSLTEFKDGMFASYGVVFSGAYAVSWLNKHLQKWLGEKNAADILAQSVDNNVTSEMGLELLDVADVVREYPAVLEYFKSPGDETFFEDLAGLAGGPAVSNSIREFLKKYGMRCSAEIDISRIRWHEKPAILVPMLLANIQVYEPGGHKLKFEQGLEAARQKEAEILSRLKQMPGGKRKAKKAKRMIRVLRNYAGYREFNKYVMVCYEWIVKQALMKQAAILREKNLVREKEDIYFLTLEELDQVIKTSQLDYETIEKRKADFAYYQKLTPPRVITAEGEIISGEYDTGGIPANALAGTPVSAGVREGRARVILSLEDAVIEDGDILVTTFTDPSWTPVFVSIKGLVTEVGGMMTHGAVVAREYGLPAVVGVENATKLIKDGQRIRLNGTEGYVEILA